MAAATCHNCATPLDTEEDVFAISPVNDAVFCDECRIQDLTYGSIVVIAGPGFNERDEAPQHIVVGDFFREDRYGDDYNDVKFERSYKRSDAWRGFYETTIPGWTEILTGWTTGPWGDQISVSKQAFNDWARSLCEGGEAYPPVPVAIVNDPTSNVFSTGISVLVPSEHSESFCEWLGDEIGVLHKALR